MLHDRIKQEAGRAATEKRRRPWLDLPTPYLLFLGDATEAGYAKTAFGLRDWAPEKCVGEHALPGGDGHHRPAPHDAGRGARRAGARAMVIGIANSGGFIAPNWIPALVEALEAGLDIVSGMHARLDDDPAAAPRRPSGSAGG